MKKLEKIYVREDLCSYLTGNQVIEALQNFAEKNGVGVGNVVLEKEYYEDGTMYLETYRPETDEEFNKRVSEHHRRQAEADAVDRQKYEELKKRFG